RLRVLGVDRHEVVHWGFRTLLTAEDWVERYLAASSCAEAIDVAHRYEPHVALVDISLGAESGAELCDSLRSESPITRVRPPVAQARSGLRSERELEVLDLIGAGRTNKEIADTLYLSPHTVKDHTRALYRKIGARNRAEAILRAQRLGLLS